MVETHIQICLFFIPSESIAALFIYSMILEEKHLHSGFVLCCINRKQRFSEDLIVFLAQGKKESSKCSIFVAPHEIAWHQTGPVAVAHQVVKVRGRSSSSTTTAPFF